MNLITTSNETTKKVSLKKSIGSLAFYFPFLFSDLTNEKINVQIERANGGNIEITNGFVNLKDFLAIGTYGNPMFTKFDTYKCATVVELCENGAIHLHDNDTLVIELKDLDSTKVYTIDGIEEPFTSDDVYTYQRKSMASTDENIDFLVKTFDIVQIKNPAIIDEISFKYDNGEIVKYTTRELRVMSLELDPFFSLTDTNEVVTCDLDFIILPLKGVEFLTIRKPQGQLVNLFLRDDQEFKELNYLN